MIEVINNFQDYILWVQSLNKEFGDGRILFYRGHADTNWRLLPYVKREGFNFNEKRIILDYKQTKISEFDYYPRIEQYLIEMQHNGIPTRLLDWTFSPLVALYFACNENSNNGAVYVLNPWQAYKNMTTALNADHPRRLDILKEIRFLLAQGWDFKHIYNYIHAAYNYLITQEWLEAPLPFVSPHIISRVKSQDSGFLIWGNNCSDLSSLSKIEPYSPTESSCPQASDSIYMNCLKSVEINEGCKKELKQLLKFLFVRDYSIFPDFEGFRKEILEYGTLY